MADTELQTPIRDDEGFDMPSYLVGGFVESFESRYPTSILETLLLDRTTGQNIIWADNEYEALGPGYLGDDEITVEKVTGLSSGVIKPRVAKAHERRSKRTKSRAEVFTPSWLCNQMINDLDAAWFGHRDIFNTEGDASWSATDGAIVFPKRKGRGWHAYVEARYLEITCGEGPFVCSRYDTVTGHAIPVNERIGFLDRKLRIVSERTKTRSEWVKRALCALKSCYGFEYQGDNLLIARINVFETFCEHLRSRWGDGPTDQEMNSAADVVSWNFWQMDGFNDAVPTNKMGVAVHTAAFEPKTELSKSEFDEALPVQLALFDVPPIEPVDEADASTAETSDDEDELTKAVPLCVLYNWLDDEPFEFNSLKGKACPMEKKFYAVIGNPPYQAEPELGSTRSLPIYDTFMDEAYKVATRAELVTPARFLFGSGQTNTKWNEKMLADEHLEVSYYEPDSSRMFPNVDIKGGVAVTYRDITRKHKPIGLFIPAVELKSIVAKVSSTNEKSLADVAGTQCNYNFDELYKDHPDYSEYISGNGRHSQLKSNSLERVPVFKEERSERDDVQILGLVDRKRVHRYCLSRYIDQSNKSLFKYKVIIPASNGSGAFGETLSSPLVEGPGTGFTQTFMCIGAFDTKEEADAALKYIKSKFARALLGVLKTTQHNPPATWRMVPLQDFTSNSTIDWSTSIDEIDRQLYSKYQLDDREVEFVETNVKEMD